LQVVLIVVRGRLAKVGVTSSNVAAVRPAEHRELCFFLTAPTLGALYCLAFEGGVEAFGGGVVRGVADRACARRSEAILGVWVMLRGWSWRRMVVGSGQPRLVAESR
jgi:hypothetical protein